MIEPASWCLLDADSESLAREATTAWPCFVK
jgi:hypothetical protein